jgi:hypothetical protein
VGYVENAREYDPRKPEGDPMLWHRHRIHPELWRALAAKKNSVRSNSLALKELEAFRADEKHYVAMRPIFSPLNDREPWK